MANRNLVQMLIAGAASGLATSTNFVSSPTARMGMTAAATLLEGVAKAVEARGTDEVRALVHELAATPPRRASLDAARDAVAEALAGRDDAPVDDDAPEAGEEDA